MEKLPFRSRFSSVNSVKSLDNISPDEHVLTVAHQHPFGIIIMYFAAFAGFIGAITIMGLLLPNVFSNSASSYAALTIFSLITAAIVAIILVLATNIYRQSMLTVTDRNVIQLLQNGMLNRKISQISLANVEDVSSQQKGFFANMFNFGVIKIETAGEQASFIFSFCPDANKVAKTILDAKDEFLIATGQAGSYRNNVKGGFYGPAGNP